MTTSVVPIAKAVYLCDFHVGYQDGKTDLYGLFNAIRPQAYPHIQRSFVIFAQLLNGLGDVSLFVDIRHAGRDELIYTTNIKVVRFPDRTTLVQMGLVIEGYQFAEPGVYLVELFCNNMWVADTTVVLLEV